MYILLGTTHLKMILSVWLQTFTAAKGNGDFLGHQPYEYGNQYPTIQTVSAFITLVPDDGGTESSWSTGN